jgi:hypothetical protein
MEIAQDRGSRFYCKIVDGKLELRKSHAYYYQCVGQMAITGVHDLDFVIYAPRTGEIVINRLGFVEDEWIQIFEKLASFKQRHFA